MNVRAVCFDLDGTLYDDRQYIRAGFCSAAEMLTTRNGINVYEDLNTLFFDKGIRAKTFDKIVEKYGLSDDLVPELVEAFHSHEADLNPYPEVTSVLNQIDHQYRTGLITGGKNGHTKLERLGLRSYFDEILVTQNHGLSKSSPEPFNDVLKKLSTCPANAVYIGDQPNIDFPQPNELGIYTIRVRRGIHAEKKASGRAQANVEVGSLKEVLQIIREDNHI